MKKQIPNILTFLRIFLIPFFIYCLVQNEGHYKLVALGVFILASITDFFDGYFARKFSAESEFGKILDPLADKLLVVASLSAFVYLDNQIPLWMVIAIVARDLLITLIRSRAQKKGVPIKISRLAKAKTAFQMISILIILVIFSVRSYRQDIQETFQESVTTNKTHSQAALKSFMEAISLLPNKEAPKQMIKKKFAESIPYFLMFFVTILTLISGVRYFITNYRLIFQQTKNTGQDYSD